MMKSIKYSLLLAVLGSLLLTGCDDLFTTGDTERSYEGPDKVAFRTQENEITEGESQTLEIQFISSEGLAPSDVTVNLSVSSSDNFDSYTVSSTSVTISSGSATGTVTLQTSNGSGLASGDEGTVTLTIDGASGAEVAPNLSSTTVYVAGVD